MAGERVKLGPVSLAAAHLAPGEIEVGKQDVLVGTGTRAVRLGEVQGFGKRQMPAADWARGLRLESGARFGAAPGGGPSQGGGSSPTVVG